LFSLFSLAPLFIVGILVSQLVRDTYRESVQTSFSQAVGLREELAQRYFESMRGLVRSIAAQDLLLTEIDTALGGGAFDDDTVFVTLVSLRRSNPFIEKVSILRPSGEVILSTASDEEGLSFRDAPYFRTAISDRTGSVGSVFVSSYGKRVIPITAPLVRKRDNTVMGVLVLEVNISALNTELSPQSNSAALDRAVVYAVDEDGYLMTKIQSLPPDRQLWTLPVRQCQREGQSMTGSWPGAIDSEEVFGVSRCVTIDHLRFTLIAEEPARSAFAVSSKAATVVFATALGVIAVLAGVIALVSHSITTPILRLRTAARELGKGNFNFTIEAPTSQDELADLAIDFDRARTKLQAAREQEIRLTQMKSEFISIAAHQLRTPLTGIKWSIEDLLSNAAMLPMEKHADLKRTIRSINELISLVNDLLNVSRIEDGRMEYRFEEGDLYAFTAELAESIHMRHKEKTIKLVIAPAPAHLPRCIFDREKMSIVLTNLIDNAIKYTPDTGTVRVSVLASTGSVVVEVADTGIGVPQAEIQNLFTKFFRAKNAISTQASGSGLGLFVAQQIARAHGGGISVDSTEGSGTVMRVQLPLVPPAQSSGPTPASVTA
jgi:signal transduction histidine kinase